MRQLLNLLCVGLLGGMVSGCVAVAAIASKASPPPAVPAEYKPAKELTLVLVESYENPDLYEVESERIARDLTEAFAAEKKTFPVVPEQRLMELKASKGSEFRQMSVPGIAKALGAKQVIYVDLMKFTADPAIGSETMRGEARATVKLVDADTGHTLWPRDSSVGREISYTTPALSAEGTSRNAVQQQLYEHMGEQIEHLFHDWVDEAQQGNPPDSITNDNIK
jgi:hypothetical protein